MDGKQSDDQEKMEYKNDNVQNQIFKMLSKAIPEFVILEAYEHGEEAIRMNNFLAKVCRMQMI